MADRVCRWAFLSTAGIARKNWKSIWNAPNATLTAVASRDEKKAQQFIDECQSHTPFVSAPRAVGGYESVLTSDDVDAVYLPMPSALRKQWALRAAEAGKHILLEKPCGNDAGDVAEIIAACKANNVHLMDGVMLMHSDRLTKVREVLDDGQIGKLKRIVAHHTFCGPDDWLQTDIRLHSDLEPLGCIGDLGWYCTRIILWTMNWETPQKVSGRLLTEMKRDDSPHPVPIEFSSELFFANGVSANFYCSFATEHQQWVTIGGTKGFLHIPDYVLPSYNNELEFFVSNAVFDINHCDFNMERHVQRFGVPEYASGHPNAQETKMIRNFSDAVLSGNHEKRWGEYSLLTQQVLDGCLESARADGKLIPLNVG